MDAVIGAALDLGADAIHPGYGFLSERAEFADKVAGARLTFVGPSADSIRLMGDKAQARSAAQIAGVPTVPGSDGAVETFAQAEAAIEKTGFPVLVKAAGGGGGRGIRTIYDATELKGLLPVAQAEAHAAFGNGQVYIERFVPFARHIEVQVFGDGERFVHLGERECSMQRRRQKVLEEAGAPGLPSHVRAEMTAAAVALASATAYRGAGTVEFLHDPVRGEFYFIEMNTRIQVEHPVTEMITGTDLVREQLLIASDQELSWKQDLIEFRGHAIEVRINAEKPDFGFMPSPGIIKTMHMPGGPFVRIDSGFGPGKEVSPYYDSLIAKLIVWGENRNVAIARMRRALSEIEVEGVSTTTDFLLQVIQLPEFQRGEYHTTFLETWMSPDTTDAISSVL